MSDQRTTIAEAIRGVVVIADEQDVLVAADAVLPLVEAAERQATADGYVAGSKHGREQALAEARTKIMALRPAPPVGSYEDARRDALAVLDALRGGAG